MCAIVRNCAHLFLFVFAFQLGAVFFAACHILELKPLRNRTFGWSLHPVGPWISDFELESTRICTLHVTIRSIGGWGFRHFGVYCRLSLDFFLCSKAVIENSKYPKVLSVKGLFMSRCPGEKWPNATQDLLANKSKDLKGNSSWWMIECYVPLNSFESIRRLSAYEHCSIHSVICSNRSLFENRIPIAGEFIIPSQDQ